jgi:HSP90 family molecular chaperone
VANKVTVISKKNDYDPWVWESCAGKEFGVRQPLPEEAEGIKRGTKVILHMKDDQLE